MYNYYIKLKKKEKLEEEEKEKERKKKMKIIREKKMKQYTRNYENRIKKFIYDMADKPVILRESIKPFTTTREELLFEESNKILFHKGFIFNLYQTDRERLNTYINEKEKEKDYENKMISYESKNNNDNITTKITQPQMRFKPRTDLERIYHILSNYRPSKVGKKSKKIIENQLNDLLKIKLKKITNKSENMIFHDDEQKSIEQLIQDIGIDKEKKKGVFEEISKNLKLSKKKRVDNSNAKILHSDLYNKTYFNAVENYTIFKNTCFLPKKINKTYHDRSNTDTSKNFNININDNFENYKTEKFLKQRKKIIKKRNINNDNLESNSYSKNIINISSPNELVNLLCNSKENAKEENLMKSLDNVDLFIQGLKATKSKLTKKEQYNFDIVKSLAFNKKKKNLPILNEDNKTYHNSNLNDKDNDSSSNEGYEDYAFKKQEEKIKVNGIEYKKNDLEHLSKAIMESCNVSKKKYRDSDSEYSHSGNGKLMFTNGLTLKEFEKKYHINP